MGDAIGLVVVPFVFLVLVAGFFVFPAGLVVVDGEGDALATVVEALEGEAFVGELAEAGRRKALKPIRLPMTETVMT